MSDSSATVVKATPDPSRAAASATSVRRVVLTGATGGIGAAIADELAARGYRLVLLGRRVDALDALQQRLGDSVEAALSVDFLQPDVIVAKVMPMLDDLGQIDVLINNAGAGIYSRFLDQSPEEHEHLLRLNYLAPAAMIRHILPGMLERGRGHVINVASMSSKVGPWGHAGYAAAKAALVSLTQTLASEYGQRDLHFSYMNPGIIDTPYFRQPGTAGLWDLVKKHAIPPKRLAIAVAKVLDRPKLEVCVPRHFRMLDTVSAISPALALRMVTNGSKPRDHRG